MRSGKMSDAQGVRHQKFCHLNFLIADLKSSQPPDFKSGVIVPSSSRFSTNGRSGPPTLKSQFLYNYINLIYNI